MPPTKRADYRRISTAVCLRGAWLTAAVLLLALPAAAEYYRYTDADGQVHYVDDPRHIPESRLDTLRIYQEENQRHDMRRRRGGMGAASVDAEPEGPEPSTPTALESPVTVRGNQVLMPVTISYRGRQVQTNLLLDTGASFTILHQKVARRILLAGQENREAVVVGGSRIPIRIAAVDFIQVGPFRVANAQVAIIEHQGPDQNHEGLLGMDILRLLDYTLDVDRGVIVWNR